MNCAGCYSELAFKKNYEQVESFIFRWVRHSIPTIRRSWRRTTARISAEDLLFNKYTGSRGKSGSNDANPEYIAKLRKILDDKEIRYQTSELGKVDRGGGGTIAYILANYGMEVIDSGIAVQNMHALMKYQARWIYTKQGLHMRHSSEIWNKWKPEV